MRSVLILLLATWPRLVLACPFCDFGANQTAKLILIIFGFLAIGGGLIFFAYLRAGGLKASENAGAMALEAETKLDTGGKPNGK